MAENLNTAKSTPSQERDQQRQQLDSCNSLPPSADKNDNKTSGNSMTTTTNNSSTNSHRTIRSNNKGARSHQQQQHRHLCASIPSLLDAPTSRTNFYADHINKCINSNYHVGSCCSMIAVPKCFGWGGDVFNNPMNNYFCRCDIAQNVRFENGQFTMQERIYLPDNPTLKIIGRILGPRGNSLRQLQAETRCRIVIRGKGSVKDPEKERRLRGLSGWEHLHEPLHVLITAQHHDQFVCAHLLHYAGHCIKSLMVPRFDAYKKDQLLQLAIINGTYQPRS